MWRQILPKIFGQTWRTSHPPKKEIGTFFLGGDASFWGNLVRIQDFVKNGGWLFSFPKRWRRMISERLLKGPICSSVLWCTKNCGAFVPLGGLPQKSLGTKWVNLCILMKGTVCRFKYPPLQCLGRTPIYHLPGPSKGCQMVLRGVN